MGAGYVIMVGNIAQPLASLINAKAKKKAVMCEWESRFVSETAKLPKIIHVGFKEPGVAGMEVREDFKDE